MTVHEIEKFGKLQFFKNSAVLLNEKISKNATSIG